MIVLKILKKIYYLIDFKSIFTKIKNINWGIVFFVNLLITILLFTKFLDKANKLKSQTEIILNKLENYSHIPSKYLHFTNNDYEYIISRIKTYFYISITGVVLSNLLHLLLAFIFPHLYVNISRFAYIFLFLTISLAINFLLFYLNHFVENEKTRYFLISIGIISGLIGLILIFYIEKFNQTSIELIKLSTSLVIKYPLLIIIAFIQSILLFIMNALFTIIITLSFTPIWPIRHIVTMILYLLFSYYWIASTLYYVCYMTISGVIIYEFQDNNKTNCASFLSFWKVITRQFNNAVFAGLALAINQFNQHRAAKRKPRLYKFVKNRNIFIRILVWIIEIPGFVLSYILTFVYSVAESVLRDISSNALIYCMIYDCSYKEGTEKWIKENIVERIDKINQDIMIKNILYCHRIIFSIVALFISSLLLYIYNEYKEINDFIVTLIMTIILMHSTFSILCTLIRTTSENLFLYQSSKKE